MDISRANSEPFFSFHRARETLDQTIKVTTGALRDLQARAGEDGGAELVNKAVSASGEPWGTAFRLKATSSVIGGTLAHLSGLWVSHVFSLFHLFLDDVAAELSRYSSIVNNTVQIRQRTNEVGDLAIDAIYRELGWDDSSLKMGLPLFRFFETVRNCVVHRAGLASRAFVNLREDESLLPNFEAFSRGARKEKRVLPSLPKLDERKRIELLPRHSILASEVAYRIALDVNRQLINTLGTPGVVYMAAYHSILAAEHPARLPIHNHAEDPINRFLHERYRVTLDSTNECITELRDLGQWDRVLKRYKEVYGTSTTAAAQKKKGKPQQRQRH